MSTKRDMHAKRHSVWMALAVASALFLVFAGAEMYDSDYVNGDFHYAVTCFSGCNYAVAGGDGPTTAPIPRFWSFEFVFLNPGLWFGLAFSFFYAPTLKSRALPTIILGAMGVLGLIAAKIFHLAWGVPYYGILLIAAPYSLLGTLVIYAYHQLPEK